MVLAQKALGAVGALYRDDTEGYLALRAELGSDPEGIDACLGMYAALFRVYALGKGADPLELIQGFALRNAQLTGLVDEA